MVKIYNAANALEAGLIVAVLRENNIPSYWQNAPGNIVAYETYEFGFFGVDIIVDDENVEKAIEILRLNK